MLKPVALVIARRFARGGYTACVTRRTANKLTPLVEGIQAEGGQADGFASDAHNEAEIGPIDVLVFNIGANVRFSITETTERVYRKVWEMAALAGFLVGRDAARVMQARDRHRIHRQQFPRTSCVERAARHSRPRGHRRGRLAVAPASMQRRNARAGPAAVEGKRVNGDPQ